MGKYLVPENLDLSQFSFPEGTAYFLDMLIRRRFLSNLRSNRRFWKVKYDIFYADRWTTIPSRTLKNIRGNYSSVVNELLEHGIIERSYFSCEEHKAYGYRFAEPYRNVLLKCETYYPKNEKWFDKRLKEVRERERNSLKELEPGYLMALDSLNFVRLEYDKSDIDRLMWSIHKQEKARQRKEQLSPTPSRGRKKSEKDIQMFRAVHRCNHLLHKIHEIVEGRNARLVPFYKVDNYGRFHYFLTNLPKSLRPFVRLNGNKVIGYDITSSQCIFFALAVRDEAKGRDGINFHSILKEIEKCYPQYLFDRDKFLQDEMIGMGKEHSSEISYSKRRSYRRWRLDDELAMLFEVLSGDFYEFMMRKAGEKWTTEEEFKKKRGKFKNKFFEFLYGPNKSRNRIFRAFQETFPYISLVLWKMKDLGGMHRRFYELHEEGVASKVAWKQMRAEARKEKKWYVCLPLRMQEMEARFMFGRIAPQIGRPFLPVHDCIIVEETERRNVKNVKRLLENEFKKLGIAARINDEPW